MVDVTRAEDVAALVDRVTSAHGPIGGVYHTAAVLADGLIDDLDAAALARVLAPKIEGAHNLDAATRGQPLEQFVLYSSASALFGNPGQAAYCAANGFLEGLARSRRAEGLPALAVQWGAIADVGMLADRQDTMRSLERVSGVAAMQSAAALTRLGRLLAAAATLPDPVIALADFVADSAAAALPVLASPSFAGALFNVSGAAGEAAQDLAEIVAGKGDVEAQRIIAEILGREVAQILRLPAAEIDLDASIDRLGMDSLMALELRMSIESRYRVELPVMAISGGTNIRALAHRLLRSLRDTPGGGEEEDGLTTAEAGLLAMHGGGKSPGEGADIEIEVALRSSAGAGS
jgi:acyl carrier protein